MRVLFLSPGGVEVEHATALTLAGADVVTAERAPAERFDVAVACGWRSAAEAWRADAARRVSLVLRLEHRAMAPERPERMAAVAALDLPWDAVLATSAWLEAAIAEQHPGARVAGVPVGYWGIAGEDPGAHGPATALRIAGAPAAVLEAMSEPHAPANGGFDVLVDMGEPLREELAALAPPRSPLAPLLTAFALGATAVAVPTEGRDEVLTDGSGLVVDPDDFAGAAHALDALARDPEELGRLRAGAAAAIGGRPTWDDAGARLREALEGVVAAPGLDAGEWPARLMTGVTAEAAKLAAYESARADEMHAWAQRLEERAEELAERGRGRRRGRRS